jgi:hypothetical protein
MVHPTALTAAAAALLLALPCSAGGLYAKNSPVLQVDAKNYDRLIAKSNHTSVSTQPESSGASLISGPACRILCSLVRSLQEPTASI